MFLGAGTAAALALGVGHNLPQKPVEAAEVAQSVKAQDAKEVQAIADNIVSRYDLSPEVRAQVYEKVIQAVRDGISEVDVFRKPGKPAIALTDSQGQQKREILLPEN